jgi:hypothetical protein
MSFVDTGRILCHASAREARSVGDTPIAAAAYDAPVLIFLLLGYVPWLLVLTLVVVMWLTVVELLEWRPHYLWWFWWLFFVFLTNFVGYLFLRAYRVYQRWDARTG